MMFKRRMMKPLLYCSVVALLGCLAVTLPVHAGPKGGQIVGGVGAIKQNGLTTNIQQNTQNLAINWNSYNLNSNEKVNYLQPNSSSIALNRVLGGSASQIFGQINANGQVVLVNPNGIFFGKNASVNVGGLIASGLDIDPIDFMNGDYLFNAIEGTDGVVINSGLINASLGGNVGLLGQQVANEGVISAQLGSVVLAAGNEAILTFDNEGMIGVQVTKEVLQDDIGVDPAVVNSGDIEASGGRVLLTASVSQDVFSNAVNHNGIEQATSVVVHEDGSFTLGGGANVVNSGAIDVSSSGGGDAGTAIVLGQNIESSGSINADSEQGQVGFIELHARDSTELTGDALISVQATQSGQGGQIQILGDKVGLFDQAEVNVDGVNGGGEILIGGDQQGQNDKVRNAEFIYLGENTRVSASAADNGGGGTIITYADDTARIYGSLNAKGGENSGDGGFVETSGKQGFNIWAAPDISAANGDGGLWLIDPFNIKIGASGSSGSYSSVEVDGTMTYTSINTPATISFTTIEGVLETGDVEIITGACTSCGESGDIIFSDFWNYSGSGVGTLTLNASEDIFFATNAGIASVNALNLFLFANGQISLIDNNSINTQGGNFIIGGSGGNTPASISIASTSSINTVGGNLEINTTQTNNFTIQGMAVGNGDLTISTGGNILQNGAFSVNGTGAVLDLTAGNETDGWGDITLDDSGNDFATVLAAGKNVIVRDTNAINLGTSTAANELYVRADGDITNTSGGITVSGDAYVATAYNSDASITLDDSGNSFDGNVYIIDGDGTGDGNQLHNLSIRDSSTDGLILQQTVSRNNSSTRDIDLTGNLVVSSAGPVTQNSDLVIAGTTSIDAGANSITLLRGGNDFGSAVSLSTTGATSHVEIADSDNIDLGASASGIGGNLYVQADGDITDSGDFIVGGNTYLETSASATSSITLDNGASDYGDTISFIDGGNGFTNITLDDDTALALQFINNYTDQIVQDTLNVGGNINVTTNGALSQNSALNVTGTSDFDAGDGSIMLNDLSNTFGSTVTLNTNGVTGHDVTFNHSDPLTLGQSEIGGDLKMGGSGWIGSGGQTGSLTVHGTSEFTLDAGHSMILDHTGNNFVGAVSIDNDPADDDIQTGFTVTIVDSNDLKLGVLDISNKLNVTALAGDITGNSGIAVLGAASFTAVAPDTETSSISLTSDSNVFNGSVDFSGSGLDSVTIHDSNDLELPGLSLTSLTVNSGGTISQGSNNGDQLIVTGTSSFSAANAITLKNGSNDFGGAVSFYTTGSNNNVEVTDSNGFNLGASTINGGLYVEADGDITNGGDAAVTGDAYFATGLNSASSITLDSGLNNFESDISFIDRGNGFVDITIDNNSAVALQRVDNYVDQNIQNTLILGGSLTVVSGGDITQNSALNVANSSFTATGYNVTLENSNNNFDGINVEGKNVKIADSGHIILFDLSVTGTLDVTANGNIFDYFGSDTGTSISVIGAASFDTGTGVGANIWLGSSGNDNDFQNSISFNGDHLNNVRVADSDGIDLGQSNIGGELYIRAGGNISDSGVVTVGGDTYLETIAATATSIMLNNPGNELGDVVSFIDGSGNGFTDITLVDGTALTLQSIDNYSGKNIQPTLRLGGNLNVHSGGALISSAIDTSGGAALTGNPGQNAGDITLQSDSGDITIGGAITANGGSANPDGTDGGAGGDVSITASNGSVSVAAINTNGGTEGTGSEGVAGSINLDASSSLILAGNLLATGIVIDAASDGLLGINAGNDVELNGYRIDVAGVLTLGRNLTVSNSTSFDAGSIAAQGADDRSGQSLDVTTSGDITLGNVDTSGGTATGNNPGQNAGNVILESTAGVVAVTGAINANGSAANGVNNNGGNGGDVSISGAVGTIAVSVDGISADGGAGSGSGSEGNAGSISLVSTTGLDLGGDLSVTGVLVDTTPADGINDNGFLNINAGSAVSLDGYSIDVSGLMTLNQNLTVSNTLSNNTHMTLGSIAAQGTGGSSGHTLDVTTSGDITIGSINTSGEASAGTNPGQNAGDVTLLSSGGNVTISGAINADGSQINTGNNNGGNGGDVSITTNIGNISVAGISVDGNAGSGSGADGEAGSITLASAGVLSLGGDFFATGTSTGSNGSLSMSSGSGNIELNRDINIDILGDFNSGNVDGSGADDNAGYSFSVTTPGNISVASINTSGGAATMGHPGQNAGDVTLTSSGGAITVSGPINANGSDASVGVGGNGGVVNISTTGGSAAITVAGVSVDGGAVDGEAGSITLDSNGALLISGDFSTTGSSNGSNGTLSMTAGVGYDIDIVGSIAFDLLGAFSSDFVDASGDADGVGYAFSVKTLGDINIAGIDTSGGMASLGNPGQSAGDVTLISTLGSVTVSSDITANGSDGSTGGNGGSVSITTGSGSIAVAGVNANGGKGSGGTNGEAGSISLDSASTIAFSDDLSAQGALNLAGDNGGIEVVADGAIDLSSLVLTAVGSSSFTSSTGGDLTLNNPANNFGSVDVSGGSASILDVDDIGLSGASLSGTLDVEVTGAGDVIQTGALQVGSSASFTVNGGRSIVLDEPANSFAGAVSVSSNTGTDLANVELANNAALDLGDITVTDHLSITANGAITDTGTLRSGGVAGFDANGNAVTLNSDNYFNHLVLVDASTAEINEIDGFQFGSTLAASSFSNVSSNVTSDLMITTGGMISDEDSLHLNVGGTTSLSAIDSTSVAQDIVLDAPDNNFNIVSIVSANDVTLADVDAIQLATSDVSGDLNVTAAGGNISQAANSTITVTGASSLNASADINLAEVGNDFSSLSVTGVNADLKDANGIELTGANLTGTFDVEVTGTGNIIQSAALEIGGNATFTVNGGRSIVLDEPANLFAGAVSFFSNTGTDLANVELANNAALDLGDISVTDHLSITANGAITDTGTLRSGGIAGFDANGNAVTLNSDNYFNHLVLVDASTAEINEVDGFQFGSTLAASSFSNVSSNVTSDLTITTGGMISDEDSLHLNVGGRSSLSAIDSTTVAQDIVLDASDNNFNIVSIVSANDVTLADVDALQFESSDVSGDLNVTAAGGNITQALNSLINVTGATVMNSSADIILEEDNNDLSSIDLTAVNATVRDTGGIELAGVDLTGDLDIRVIGSGSISQSSDILMDVGSLVTLSAANNVILGNDNNDFYEVEVLSANDVVLDDTNGLIIRTSEITNDLSVTAYNDGNIKQNGNLVVGGLASFIAAGDDVDLGNDLNEFATVEVVANNATLSDADGIFLGASSVDADLTVTANSNGDIEQSGALSVGGVASFTATGDDVVLGNDQNEFATVEVFADNVTLSDANGIFLGASSVGTNLTVTANSDGDIEQSGPLNVGGLAMFTAVGDDVVLGNNSNQFTTLGLMANNATIADANSVELAASDLSNDLSVTANGNGDIGQSGAVKVGGIATLSAEGNAIYLGDDNANDFSSVLLTANSANLIDADGLILGASSVSGELIVEALNGDVTQIDSSILTVGGPVQLTATGGIALDQSGNDFSTVALSASYASLADADGIELAASDLSGDLTITAYGSGDISSQAGEISVGGLAKFVALGNVITLTDSDNRFSNVALEAASASLDELDGFNFSTTDIDSDLKVVVAGNIGQIDTVSVGGYADITATGFDISLTQGGNDFSTILLDANNVTLVDSNDIVVGASNITGDLSLTVGSTGDITQAGVLAVQGDATLVAEGDNITLNNSDNDLNTVSLTAHDVTLTDSNALVLNTSTLTGGLNVSIKGAGDLTQGGPLSVEGNSSFDVNGGRSIDLGNTNNLFQGSLSIASNTADPLLNVDVANNAGLDLGTITVSNNMGVVANGSITNSGVLSSGGIAGFDANGHAITLNNSGNDFTHLVILNASSASVTDKNGVQIGSSDAGSDYSDKSSNVSGDLNITTLSGSITDENSVGLTVAGLASFDSGSEDIVLDSAHNNFSVVNVLNAQNVNLADSNAIDLQSGTIAGDLSVLAGSDITTANGSLVVLGNSSFTTGPNHSVLLTDPNNSLGGELTLTSSSGTLNNVSVVNTEATSLAGIDVGNNLSIKSDGAITQSAVFNVGNSTTLDAGNADIVLNADNTFNELSIVSADQAAINNVSPTLTISDVQVTSGLDLNAVSLTQNGNINAQNGYVSLDLGGELKMISGTSIVAGSGDIDATVSGIAEIAGVIANDGNINFSTGGAISDKNGDGTNFQTKTLVVRSSGGIGDSDFIDTSVNTLDVINDSYDDVNLSQTGQVLLTSLQNNGDINFESDRDIYFNPGGTVSAMDSGDLVMSTSLGNFYGFDDADSDNPDITARNAKFIGLAGTFGSYNRYLTLKVPGTVFIQTRGVFSPQFVPPLPTDVYSEGIDFSILGAISAIAGEQLVEIETLSEIDPAIFTALRNYTFKDVSIRMPRDQLYEDELDEEEKVSLAY